MLERLGDLRPPIAGEIQFDSVRFSYASRPDVEVLQGMSFVVPRGQLVAVVGMSGSGKSTVASLVQRFYEPSSGQVLVDSHPLGSIDTKWIRQHIAVVSQHAALFDTTVTANISYGSPAATFDDVVLACREANVHDFIMTLPHGYQTNLGESASLISGGQAQRLQIARALVKRAPILILDECTSALDPENEAIVLDTILSVRSGRTVLMITHKVPAMQLCDRVLVLGEGQVLEDGSFESLMAQKGTFAELARGGEWQ